MTIEELKEKEFRCMQIAEEMFSIGNHYAVIVYLTEAAGHWSDACYLQDLDSWADEEGDHKPMRADQGQYILALATGLYQSED